MNKIILIGNITHNLELKQTTKQKIFLNFSLAVKRDYKNANEEYETDFINCQMWGKQAEHMAQYLSKGSQVAVSGRLQIRSYENKEGQKVYVSEVICDSVQFLNSKKKEQEPKSVVNEYMGVKDDEISDTELPF